MKQWLMDLLKALEVAAPPGAKRHHAITAAKYGSDETGWDDRLALQVSCGGKFQTFFLDAEDFGKSPQDLVAEIVKILAETPKPHNTGNQW